MLNIYIYFTIYVMKKKVNEKNWQNWKTVEVGERYLDR